MSILELHNVTSVLDEHHMQAITEPKVGYLVLTRVLGNLDLAFGEFFGDKGFEHRQFDNFQTLDKAGLLGRFFSSSYAPLSETDLGKIAARKLNDLFEKFQTDNSVALQYRTELYLGGSLIIGK